MRPSGKKIALGKVVVVENTGCDSILVCDSFDHVGAESISREESEAWRDEDLTRSPANLELEGNLSFGLFWEFSSCWSSCFLRLEGWARA